MKKILIFAIVAFSFSTILVQPISVNADDFDGTNSSGFIGENPSGGQKEPVLVEGGQTPSGMTPISNPLKAKSVGELVQTAATIFSYIAVLVGVLALLWTGLQYILAQGNSEKIKELKSQLLWVVVGIGIVIGARIIVSVVINTLSASGVVNENIINSAEKALKNQ